MKKPGGNTLPHGLPRGKKARLALYTAWAQAALSGIVGESDMYSVRVLEHVIGLAGKQWRVRVEGPDGGFERDIDMASSQAEINQVVESAVDEVRRGDCAFARL